MHQPDALISSAAGRGYWEGVDADVAGMLGGFPAVSHVDVVGSRAFLAKMGIGARGKLRRVERVLEGGAGYVPPLPIFFHVLHFLSFLILIIPTRPQGPSILTPVSIGRVTQAVLAPISEAVDAIEPIAKFTGPLSSIPGVGRVFAEGLEDWRPDEADRYDVVWNQWCVGPAEGRRPGRVPGEVQGRPDRRGVYRREGESEHPGEGCL